MGDGAPGVGDLAAVGSAAELAASLERLRRRAARGTGRARVGLDAIAARTSIPRSTVHAYLSGVRLPPPDALDAIVVALHADAAEQRAWADALERVAEPQAGSASPVFPAPIAGDNPVVVVPRELPAPPHRFVGRAAELAALDALLPAESSAARVAVVTGTGGVGKTALALRWAWSVADAFPDGQLWLDLRGYSRAPASRGEDVLERMLRSVGVAAAAVPPEVEARAALFRSVVADRRMLLVFDNARDSAQLQELLPGTPGCVCVVTSRDELRSLALATDARRVRIARMPAHDAAAVLGAGLPTEVAAVLDERAVADQCEGLPLALRIVRERLLGATPDEARTLVDDLARGRADRLAALDLNDSSVDVSVRGALALSYAALAPEHARVFRCLAQCLVPSFDEATVAAVSGSEPAVVRRSLDVLVAANLLDSAGSRRYRIHDLVAIFAAERLRAEDGPGEIAARAARLIEYLGRSTQAATHCCDPQRACRLEIVRSGQDDVAPESHTDPVAALEWLRSHVDLIVAVVEQMCARGADPNLWAMLERAWLALYFVGDVGRIEPLLVRAIELADDAGASLAQMQLLRMLGISLGRSSRWEESIAAFERSEATARSIGDIAWAAKERSQAATALMFSGDLERAETLLRASLEEFATRLHDDVGVGFTLTVLVKAALDRGDLDAVAGWLEQVPEPLTVPGRAVNHEFESLRAVAEVRQGLLEDAERRLLRLVPALEAAGRRSVLSTVHVTFAELRRLRGDLPGARAAAGAAAELAQSVGMPRAKLEAWAEFGSVALLEGRAVEATLILVDALAVARTARLSYPECDLMIRLGQAYAACGDRVRAANLASRALVTAESCGFRALADQARDLVHESWTSRGRPVAGARMDPLSEGVTSLED